jgi:hypothetical protein
MATLAEVNQRCKSDAAINARVHTIVEEQAHASPPQARLFSQRFLTAAELVDEALLRDRLLARDELELNSLRRYAEHAFTPRPR